MSDNNKNTCPVCFTKMRNIKNVLTCPECGYKYCDHSYNRQDMFGTTHTHTPDYTTYTNTSTSYSNTTTNYGSSSTATTTQRTTSSPSASTSSSRNTTPNYTSNNTGRTGTGQTNKPNTAKIVKIIIIIHIILVVCPIICAFAGVFLSAGEELFSHKKNNHSKVEIEVPSISTEDIVADLDLDGLHVEIPSIPDIPSMPSDFNTDPTVLMDDGNQFIPHLAKTICGTDSLTDISPTDLKHITHLEIRKNDSGCYYAIYNDSELGNVYSYSSCTECDASDLWLFSSLDTLRLYDTPIEAGDLYGLRVLSHLTCTMAPDELKNCLDPTELYTLQLYLPEGVTSLDGLEEFTSLYALDINACQAQITDASAIMFLPELTELSYEDSGALKDFSFLNSMSQLWELKLNTPGLQDINFLRTFSELDTLELKNTTVSNLSPLVDIAENLSDLTLNHNANISDYSPISKLDGIVCLNLEYCNLDNIDFLSELYNINLLYIGHNSITTLAPVKNCFNLFHLDAQSNPIEDFAGLEELCVY